MTDERPEFMRWLSPLEPQNRNESVRANRLNGVGNWLLEANELRECRSGKGGADKAILLLLRGLDACKSCRISSTSRGFPGEDPCIPNDYQYSFPSSG